MIGKEIVIGLASIAWGGAMLYYANAKHAPTFVKLFVSTWWAKSNRVNGIICTVFGFCTVISGIRFFVAGIDRNMFLYILQRVSNINFPLGRC